MTNNAPHQLITACAFIHAEFDGVQKVFLPKRAAAKAFMPDAYEMPGGHIEFGEDIIEGLKREIWEEFEMEIKVGEPFGVFTYLNKAKNAHYIEVVYFAQFSTPIANIKIHPEDHSTYGWFAEDEIKTKVTSQQKDENDDEFKLVFKGFSLLKQNRI